MEAINTGSSQGLALADCSAFSFGVPATGSSVAKGLDQCKKISRIMVEMCYDSLISICESDFYKDFLFSPTSSCDPTVKEDGNVDLMARFHNHFSNYCCMLELG